MKLLIMLVAFLGVMDPLLAQPSNQPNDIELAQAKAKYETAARLYDLGQYEQALRGFRESFLISGAPALLVNIGQCYRALRQDEEAIKAFESYLRADPEGEYRADVERLLSDLKAQQKSTKAVVPKAVEKPPITQQPVFYYGIGGTLGATGLILGSVSLGNAVAARNSFDENLLAQSQEQFRKARTTAAIADAFLIGGAVGMYIGHKKSKANKTGASRSGTPLTTKEEAPVAAIKIKRQQVMLQVYF